MRCALDIAKYILCIAQENGDLITNLKLQKLLYYAQAWFMVNNDGERLFEDEIEAWQYGPIVKAVYNEYKRFGRQAIELEDCNLKTDFGFLSDNVKTFLDEFCQEYFRYSAFEMVASTHQEKPWQEAVKQGYNTIIDTNLMFKYYSEMLKEND